MGQVKKSAPTAATVKGTNPKRYNNLITLSKSCQFKILTAELRKCKFPNVAAEYSSFNIHISTFIDFANVTGALFQAFLDGKVDLTTEEFKGVWRQLNRLTLVKRSYEYLISPVLSYYDLTIPKHYRKVLIAYRAYEKAKESKHADDIASLRSRKTPSLEEIVNGRYITRAFYNRLLSYMEDVQRSEWAAARKAQKRDI